MLNSFVIICSFPQNITKILFITCIKFDSLSSNFTLNLLLKYLVKISILANVSTVPFASQMAKISLKV